MTINGSFHAPFSVKGNDQEKIDGVCGKAFARHMVNQTPR